MKLKPLAEMTDRELLRAEGRAFETGNTHLLPGIWAEQDRRFERRTNQVGAGEAARQAAYEEQQRNSCLSDHGLDLVTHDPRD